MTCLSSAFSIEDCGFDCASDRISTHCPKWRLLKARITESRNDLSTGTTNLPTPNAFLSLVRKWGLKMESLVQTQLVASHCLISKCIMKLQ